MSIRLRLCRSFGGSARGDAALLSSFAPAAALLAFLLVTSSTPTTRAQEVSIPDPGLNAAIRETLQKPDGPLTEQDLLSLTNLNARNRNVSSLEGLEAAQNLVSLELEINDLSSLSVPSELKNLTLLNLSSNPLTNCFIPDGLTNLDRILIESGRLTNLTLPADLTELAALDLGGNRFTSFSLPPNLKRLGAVTNQVGAVVFTNVAPHLSPRTFYRALYPSPLTNIHKP